MRLAQWRCSAREAWLLPNTLDRRPRPAASQTLTSMRCLYPVILRSLSGRKRLVVLPNTSRSPKRTDVRWSHASSKTRHGVRAVTPVGRTDNGNTHMARNRTSPVAMFGPLPASPSPEVCLQLLGLLPMPQRRDTKAMPSREDWRSMSIFPLTPSRNRGHSCMASSSCFGMPATFLQRVRK